MNALLLLQALAPIGIELAGRIAEAIRKDDLTILTPEDWLALLRLKQQTSEERLLEILRKHQPGG